MTTVLGSPDLVSSQCVLLDSLRRTLSGRFYVPNFISESAADIIFKLLQVSRRGATGM